MKSVAATLAILLLLAACGGGGAGLPPVDRTSDTVILTVGDEGGFVPIEYSLGRVPRYVLLADGTLYSPGIVPAIYPGPAMWPVFVGHVDQATVDRVLALVGELGLPETDRIDDTSVSNVADASTTVITYTDDQGDHVLSVYALGFAESNTDAARGAADLIGILDEAAASSGASEWDPDRIEVWTGDDLGLADTEFRSALPWPLVSAPDALPEIRHGFRCTVIDGSEAETLLETLRSANQATVWEFEGVEHALVARPLLPGRQGCA